MNRLVDNAAKAAAILGGDPGAEQRVEKLVQQGQIAMLMADARVSRGISQRQLAKAIGCSASKVCKVESARDADLRIGDIVRHLSALGLETTVGFEDKSLPASVQIKRSVFLIKDKLDALADLAKQVDDDEVVKGIHTFYVEVLFNFLAKFEDSHNRLCSAVPGPAEMNLDSTAKKPTRSVMAAKSPRGHRRHALVGT
jgi:transcriptional regulator with XRE-family HTH domain